MRRIRQNGPVGGRTGLTNVILGGSGQIKLDDRLFEVRPLDAIGVAADVVGTFEAAAARRARRLPPE